MLSCLQKNESIATNESETMTRTDEKLKMRSKTIDSQIIKIARKSFHAYQVMDKLKHLLIKYIGDENTHDAINNQNFKRHNNVAKDL